MLQKILADCPESIDLTNSEHLEKVNQIVENLLLEYGSLSKIESMESDIIQKELESSIFLRLALKIALSKLYVNKIDNPIKISVVFAVYKEDTRIVTSEEHLHGEDFLRRKISQLAWLFKDNTNISWELVVVDDGCPNNSGKIAQKIIVDDNLNNYARVLFLENGIKDQNIAVSSLSSTSESQKGGAIIYGMNEIVENSSSHNHIVVFTDADLSTHLGQTGLLINPILENNKSVAIGSRREPSSVVIKKGTRNNRGKLFIYLWKRLIPNLGEIIDTQCGFKAFRKQILSDILEDMIEKKFAFDIELLLKSEIIEKDTIEKVPIAWIDSEAASTTTDIQPYLSMLKSIALMYKKYFPENGDANQFAEFIESMNEDNFNELLENIPTNITDKEPIEFNNYKAVTVNDLRSCIE